MTIKLLPRCFFFYLYTSMNHVDTSLECVPNGILVCGSDKWIRKLILVCTVKECQLIRYLLLIAV